eukprot:932191-Rhodomonas_salina.3
MQICAIVCGSTAISAQQMTDPTSTTKLHAGNSVQAVEQTTRAGRQEGRGRDEQGRNVSMHRKCLRTPLCFCVRAISCSIASILAAAVDMVAVFS